MAAVVAVAVVDTVVAVEVGGVIDLPFKLTE